MRFGLAMVVATAFSTVVAASSAGAAQNFPTQSELTAKAAADAAEADADLTLLYRKFPKTRELIAAERAWIAYRDAECRYEHVSYPNGSMYTMEISMCVTGMTRARIELLKRDLANGYAVE